MSGTLWNLVTEDEPPVGWSGLLSDGCNIWAGERTEDAFYGNGDLFDDEDPEFWADLPEGL